MLRSHKHALALIANQLNLIKTRFDPRTFLKESKRVVVPSPVKIDEKTKVLRVENFQQNHTGNVLCKTSFTISVVALKDISCYVKRY